MKEIIMLAIVAIFFVIGFGLGVQSGKEQGKTEFIRVLEGVR